MKYHINPETYAVGECRAKIKCDFDDGSGTPPPHFSTYEDAYKESEKILRETYGDFSSYGKSADAKREEVLDKVWDSPHTKIRDGDEMVIVETPFYLFDVDSLSSTKITRVSITSREIILWDSEGNEAKNMKPSDTAVVSKVSFDEITS